MDNFPLTSEQDSIERRRKIQKTGVGQPAYAPCSPVSAITVCVKNGGAERGTVLGRNRMRAAQSANRRFGRALNQPSKQRFFYPY